VNARSSAPTRGRLTAVLTLLPVLSLWGCTGETPAPVTETVRPAYVVEARAGGAEGLGFVGEVRAARRAELAFAVSGRVAQVAVEVGDAVRRGQVLATLDTQPLAAQLAGVQGELARIEAQRSEVQQRLERVRRAQAAGAAAAGELTAVQAEAAALDAAQRAAIAQRDVASWSLEQATLRAPMDGTVAMRLVEPGQVGGPGAPVMALDGDGRELSMLLPASVPIKPGQTLTLRSAGAEQASRVLRVAGRLEAGGVRRVFLAVPADAPVGSTWVAVLAGAAPQTTLQVPLRAVLPDATAGSGRVLRLAKDGGTVEAVDVKLGALHGPRVEVTQGLVTGDKVIVAGAAGIRPGSLVRPVAYKGDVANVEVKP
jgi:RND family efflux transporter MFP subunit